MRKTKAYSDEFKKQIVMLHKNGKSGPELAKEYGITKSAVYDWVKKYNNSGSFKAADNVSEEERLLKELQKENKRLRMENDILKQAALIMGQK